MIATRWFRAEELHAQGAKARQQTPVTAVAAPVKRGKDVDATEILAAGNAERMTDLVPIRMGRMATSPFAFLRGSADVMAADLARTADTGLHGWICGDAHAANFGLYASPERRQIMDINDFDETVIGPWHWDLLRLVTSLVCAGREGGVSDNRCAKVAARCAGAYRTALAELAGMPLLEAYHLTLDHSTLGRRNIDNLTSSFDRVRKKARKNTSRGNVERFAQFPTHDAMHFVDDAPVLTHLPDAESQLVVDALTGFGADLEEQARSLLVRYVVRDVAHRIVGVSGVGYRSYVVLLQGNIDDSLMLQVTQVRPSALLPHLPPTAAAAFVHDDERVVRGQRWLQTVSDVLLGWTTIDGRPYLVRQFRDRKGTIDPTVLKALQLDDYARVVGLVLARAHAHSIDPRLLHGYCSVTDAGKRDPTGAGKEFDKAFARFAMAAADRTAADHEALLGAIKANRLPAHKGV